MPRVTDFASFENSLSSVLTIIASSDDAVPQLGEEGQEFQRTDQVT